jgi:hypothetical protein
MSSYQMSVLRTNEQAVSVAAIALLVAVCLARPAAAQVPHLINYQGRVAVSGVNFDGAGHFKFALLDAGTNLAVQAEAMAATFDLNGGILGVYVGVLGDGYTDPPAVEIQSATGTGAVLEAQVAYGKVGSILVVAPGTGYSPNDVIVIAPPPPMIHHEVYWSNATRVVPEIEPTDAVAISVNKGLYAVLLGDETIVNMSPLVAEQLAHPDVRLRVWFDDGIHGSQQVVPDQRIAAVGYALIAQTVPAEAITADKLAASAVTADKLSANAVTADKLAANAVTADKLAVGAVTADKIAAAAIVSQHLVDGAILSNHLAEASVYPFHLAGALTGGDPRIPLVEGSPGVSVGELGAITITESGSYYLTSNLTVSAGNAIVIAAPSVTLDLMGHTISSTADPAAGTAIYSNVSGMSLIIVNGHIRSGVTYYAGVFSGTGFLNGILLGPSSTGMIRNMTVSGVQQCGIYVPGYCVVDGCVVKVAGNVGIYANVVRGCIVRETGSTAIYGKAVSDCEAYSWFNRCINALVVQNSIAESVDAENSNAVAIEAVTVINVTGTAQGGAGIRAESVMNSRGQSSLNSGIFAYSSVMNSTGYTVGPASDSCGIRVPEGTVDSSKGESTGGGAGIFARRVSHSRGLSKGHAASAHGIVAVDIVSGSTGEATSGSGGQGIVAPVVEGSHGKSAARHGISASRLVTASHGETVSTVSTNRGIHAEGAAVVSSRGVSSGGSGIYADFVNDSQGISTGSSTTYSHGIEASRKVTDSEGRSTHANGGNGILATMVSGSFGYSAGQNGISGFHPQYGSRLVINSYGETAKASQSAHGLRSHHTVGSYGVANVSGAGNGICGWSVSGSSGYAVAGAQEAIYADLATHSMATRETDESGIQAIYSYRGVGSMSLGGENIPQKYDMP